MKTSKILILTFSVFIIGCNNAERCVDICVKQGLIVKKYKEGICRCTTKEKAYGDEASDGK